MIRYDFIWTQKAKVTHAVHWLRFPAYLIGLIQVIATKQAEGKFNRALFSDNRLLQSTTVVGGYRISAIMSFQHF